MVQVRLASHDRTTRQCAHALAMPPSYHFVCACLHNLTDNHPYGDASWEIMSTTSMAAKLQL